MDWSKINETYHLLSSKLNRHDGSIWKVSAGEVQSEYLEMPFWIMLYENSDIQKAHHVFQNTVEPYFSEINPVKITVAYLMLIDGNQIQVDYLEGKDEIMSHSLIGGSAIEMGEGYFAVFDGIDSSRP